MKFFKDIKGQRGAVSLLSSQLNSGKISHAYVFLGEEGTGKEFLAREFARYLLCLNLGENTECDSCKKFNQGVHSDFIFIDGKTKIKIEEVRGAIEKVNLSPSTSKKKVLLITKAEKMGIESGNALLKTFEEPPLDTVIILTAISEKSLPETIVSRGQKIRLSVISDGEIKKILLNDFAEEKIDAVIPLSFGNIGQAKRMLLFDDEYEKQKKIFSDVEKILKAESLIEKFNVLDYYEKAKSLRSFFDTFERIILKKVGEDIKESGEAERERQIAEKILKIREDLDYNVNLRLALEEIILKDHKELSIGNI